MDGQSECRIFISNYGGKGVSNMEKEEVQSFLNHIEQQEAKFLSWGYVEGGFREHEIVELAETFADQQGLLASGSELIDEAYRQGLIKVIHGKRYTVWRSRMAETVRLMARLRQWMRYHEDNWQIAPTLVSDFRFSVRHRKYPKRNVTPLQVVEQLVDLLTASECESLNEMLANRGNDFGLSKFQLRSTKQFFIDSSAEQTKDRLRGDWYR